MNFDAQGSVPFALVDEHGQLLMSGQSMVVPELEGATDIGELPPSLDHYWSAGSWLEKPPKPSNHHKFNWVNKTWFDARTADQFKSAKLKEIESERVRRTVEPILYQGSMLDADKKAQENISAKLQELGQRIDLGLDVPPAQLIWRDHANETHSFATLQDYRAWLGGLAIAITERGTAAYMWAWQMKAALAEANSIPDIQALIW